MTARRRSTLTAVLITTVVGTTVIAGGLWIAEGRNNHAGPQPVAFNTTKVTQGPVVEESPQRGTLLFSGAQPIVARATGTITGLPDETSVITPGEVLFTLDARPTVLFRGDVPNYRPFTPDMSDGADIRQLEENLRAFGLFTEEADSTFTTATADAIRSWQKIAGLEQTGTLEISNIVFSPTDIRVGPISARRGDQVGVETAIFTGTSTEKIVMVNLPLADQQLAAVDGPVTVSLPDNTRVAGTITRVGLPVGNPLEGTPGAAGSSDGAGSDIVVPVTVALEDQGALNAFVQVGVGILFPSTVTKDALTVPVEALIATSARAFAVQVPNKDGGQPETISVSLGVFQAGRVQITGNGITAGVDVVVP